MKPISKLLVLLGTLAGVLLFAVASPATAAPACWKTLINDWWDGRIDNVYPVSCYQQALKHLPTDVRTYSSAADDIKAALASRLVAKHEGKRTTAVPVAPSKGGGPSSGSGSKGRDDGNGPVQRLANEVGPKDATSVPIPLLVLAGIAGLLLAAGAAGFAARRIQARRVVVQPSLPPPPSTPKQ